MASCYILVMDSGNWAGSGTSVTDFGMTVVGFGIPVSHSLLSAVCLDWISRTFMA